MPNTLSIDLDKLTPEQQEQIKEWVGNSVSVDDWFKPEEGELYFILDDEGVRKSKNYNIATGIVHTKRQQAFRTREAAEAADQWRIALTSIRRYIAKNNIGWKGGKNRKWYIYFDSDDNKFKIGDLHLSIFSNPLNLYINVLEDAEQLIKDMEPELKILFGV